MDHLPRGPWIWRAVRLLAASGFFAYFLWFTIDGLSSWFSDDDLMNLHNSLARIVLNDARDDFYFRSLPAIELALQNAGIGSDLDRPMGLAFYRILYARWGFTAFPLRLAALLLLSANLWLLFQVARRVSGSRETAWLAMILTGFHASFASLYFDTGMIYDVLAFFFYFGALWLYLRTRENCAPPSAWRIAQVLILFVAAMNSKQIAITLPVAILLWEASRERPAGWRWLWGPGRTGAGPGAGGHGGPADRIAGHHGAAAAAVAGVGRRHDPGGDPAPRLHSSARRLCVLPAGGLLGAVAGGLHRRVEAGGGGLGEPLDPPGRSGDADCSAGRRGRLAAARARAPGPPPADRHSRGAGGKSPLSRSVAGRAAQPAPRREGAGAQRSVPGGRLRRLFPDRLTHEDMTIAVDRARFPWLAKRQFNPRDYDAALDAVDGRFVLILRP